MAKSDNSDLFKNEYLKKIISIIYSQRSYILYQIYDLSGLRLIIEKFKPSLGKNFKYKPSSFFLWFISIYFALFGIALQRYDNIYSNIEYFTNQFVYQLSSSENVTSFSRLSFIQNMKCPSKPTIYSPLSVIKSFLINEFPNDITILINDTIEACKTKLDSCTIANCNLSNLDLKEANFKNCSLYNVKLTNSNLTNANFNNSNMYNVDFTGSNLNNATINNSKTRNSKFENCFMNNISNVNSEMVSCNFQNMVSHFSNFSNSNLNDSNFNNSILEGSDFSDCFFYEASINNVSLDNVNFRDANLLMCRFENSKLDKSIISIEQLLEIYYLRNTIIDSTNYNIISTYFPELLYLDIIEKNNWFTPAMKINKLKEYNDIILSKKLQIDLSKYMKY